MANVTREILTLQLGHYSNFVGAHWWNLQEASFVYSPGDIVVPKEINHDVMFREGQTLQGEVTYTPRLIAMDLKGSLHTLKEDGALYDVRGQEEDVKWASDVTMHKTEPEPKNDFLQDLDREQEVLMSGSVQSVHEDSECDVEEPSTETNSVILDQKRYDLDESVTVWSDFLRPYLHPRSLQIISEYRHQDEDNPFQLFGQGEHLWRQRDLQNNLEDKLHFYMEECDYLQGLQMLCDVSSGFGGLASSALEQLQDDYGNKTVLLFAVEPCISEDMSPKDNLYGLINSAIAYERISANSSAILPLSLTSKLGRKPGPPVSMPYLQYKPHLAYHTSAVLAAALESLSVPYRTFSGGHVADLTNALTTQGKKVLGCQLGLPFPLQQGESLVSGLLNLGESAPWCPVSPMALSSVQPYGQSVSLSGIASQDIARLPHIPSRLSKCQTTRELIDVYLQDLYPSSLNACVTVQRACHVKTPYPHIFKPRVSKHGLLTSQDRKDIEGVETVPTASTLQSSSACGVFLQQLHADIDKVQLRKHHAFLDAGMEEDEFREVKANLLTMAENYEQPPS